MTAIFAGSGLFVFMEPTSPKGWDIRERGWFALHNGVPDNEGSGGEFHISGRGLAVDDTDMWSRVAHAASFEPATRYVLFELQLSEARCNGYGGAPLPAARRWRIDA